MKSKVSGDGKRGARPILDRTKQFVLRIVRLYVALPKTTEAQVLGRQVLKSGTSVGAHCREGHRGRSRAEFVSKINGALMEMEETGYWLELLAEAEIVSARRLVGLRREADELTAILVSIIKNARHGMKTRTRRGKSE